MTLLDKRRHRSLWSAIVADPYRKLAAIALALGLWYYLDDLRSDVVSQDLALHTVSVQSAGVGNNTGLYVRLATDEYFGRFSSAENSLPIRDVSIALRGPRERVQAALNSLVLTVDFTGVDWGNTPSREFSINDCRHNQTGFGDVVMTMIPPSVRLDVERLDRKQVEIRPERVKLTFEPQELGSRVRLSTIKFSQTRPTITGTASKVQKFLQDVSTQALPTPFKANLVGKPEDLRVTASVELDVPGLQMPELVTLEAEVNPLLKQFELDVPLLQDEFAVPPGVHYEPLLEKNDTVHVKVDAGGEIARLLSNQGSPALLDEFVRNNLRLIVLLQPQNPPEESISGKAYLCVVGQLQDRVSPKECVLAESVAITFKRIK